MTKALCQAVADNARAATVGDVEPLFVVLHNPPDTGKVKVIGIYSTEPLAEAAVLRAQMLPGFSSDPDSFAVHRYDVDEDHWPRGFVRL